MHGCYYANAHIGAACLHLWPEKGTLFTVAMNQNKRRQSNYDLDDRFQNPNESEAERDEGWVRVHIILTVKDVFMTPVLLTDVAEAPPPPFTPLFIPQLSKPVPQEGDKYWLLEWTEHLIPGVMETHWPHSSNAQVCAAWTDVKNNHFHRSSLKFWFNVDVAWLLLSELEGLDVGGGCYVRCDETTNWKFLMRPFPQGGPVCSALTESSCRRALTDASEGTFCGNELLIPEGRVGEIRLIWTLLLCLIFVMQSYSVAAAQTWKNRWLWIMVPPLLPVPAHLWLSYLKRSSPLLVCTRQDQTIIYLSLPSASNHWNIRGALTSHFVIGSEMWNMCWSHRVGQSPDGPSGYSNYLDEVSERITAVLEARLSILISRG